MIKYWPIMLLLAIGCDSREIVNVTTHDVKYSLKAPLAVEKGQTIQVKRTVDPSVVEVVVFDRNGIAVRMARGIREESENSSNSSNS